MTDYMYRIGGGDVKRANITFNVETDATETLIAAPASGTIHLLSVDINCVKNNGTGEARISVKYQGAGNVNIIRNARINDIYSSIQFHFGYVPFEDAKAETAIQVTHNQESGTTTAWVSALYYLVDI